MAKLKKNKAKPKISISTIQQEQARCPDYSSFSFAYLTSNKNYNFEHYTKSKSELKEKQSDLTKRLIEISQDSWNEWYNKRKSIGIETLNFSQINFQPKNLELSPDEKIIVFRFSSGNCRMLGVKGNFCSTCATYYIIEFDFDYSAYDHGS